MIRETRYETAPLLGLEIETAQGAELIAAGGRRYIDCCAGHGAVSLGHAHPGVTAALRAQLSEYAGPGNVAHAMQREAAAALDRMLPGDLRTMFFCTSGAEAIEVALRAARAHTGRRGIATFRGHFHGKSHGAMFLLERYPAAYGPRPSAYAAHLSDPGPMDAPEMDRSAFDAQLEALPTERLAAVICEPVIGYSGPYAPQEWFVPRLREFCDAHGLALIADEILCGLHRCGPPFVSGRAGALPDILVLGKALGNGLPTGAVAARPALRDAMAAAAPGSTFSDHPLLCAAAAATLAQMRATPELARDAARIESLFHEAARRHGEWMAAGGVHGRGRGALLGVAWPTTRGCAGPDVARRLLDRGVAVACAENRVRLTPPLTIPAEMFRRAVDALFETVRDCMAEAGRTGS